MYQEAECTTLIARIKGAAWDPIANQPYGGLEAGVRLGNVVAQWSQVKKEVPVVVELSKAPDNEIEMKKEKKKLWKSLPERMSMYYSGRVDYIVNPELIKEQLESKLLNYKQQLLQLHARQHVL